MEIERCYYCGYEMEEGMLNECENCGALYCEYCTCCEDEDDYPQPKVSISAEDHIKYKNDGSGKMATILDFSDDPEIFHNELVSEEMVESKKKIDQGTLEDNY